MKLTIIDLADFKRLDKIVTDHLPAWQKLSAAAKEIWDRQLYLAKFKTWKEWLDSHNIPESTGRKWLTVGRKVEAERLLIEMGEKKESESRLLQAKSITEALEESARDNKFTKPATVDTIGVNLPDQVVNLWNRGEQVRSLVAELMQIRRTLERAQTQKDLLWAETEVNSAIAGLSDVIRQVKTAVPYAVCPYCQGQRPESCDFCYHRGVVSKFRFSTADQELIKMQMNKGQTL